MLSCATSLTSSPNISPRPYTARTSGDICRQPSTPLSFSLFHPTGWVAYLSSVSTSWYSSQPLNYKPSRFDRLARLFLSSCESSALTKLGTFPRPQWTFSRWIVAHCLFLYIASNATPPEATFGRSERLSTFARGHFFALLLFPPYEPSSPQSSFSGHRWILQQSETNILAYVWFL